MNVADVHTMKISVERRHIEQGIPRISCKCPIALAIRETTGLQTWVSTDGVWLDRTFRELPAVARNFIRRFDNGETVVPFEFEVSYDLTIN